MCVCVMTINKRRRKMLKCENLLAFSSAIQLTFVMFPSDVLHSDGPRSWQCYGRSVESSTVGKGSGETVFRIY